MKRYLIIGPIFLCLIWLLVSKLGLVDAFFLPSLSDTFSRLLTLVSSGEIYTDLSATVSRVLVSFLVAAVLGIPIGIWLGRFDKVYRSVEFVVDFFRSTPATALFPLFILLFGITDTSKIAVAAFSSFLIIIFNTVHGVMYARKSRVLAARMMGASEWQIFSKVLFWESLPQTFVGLRSAVSLSLIVIVVTEMFIGTSVGLGRRIIDAQITYEIPTMYAVILLTGVIGYLINLIFLTVEKRVIHWVGK
jgi:sulfonate transport system permease protein